VEPAPRPRVFYGWYVVAACFLANVAYAEQFNASYGVFMYHLNQEMGWGRALLSGVKSIGWFAESAVAPFVGPLVDRYGARWLMVGGGIVCALCFVGAASLTEVWQLYLYFGILAPIAGVCLGGFVVSTTIANWFMLRRGRALGIVTMGTSFSTTVLPLAASAMIFTWGWRGAWFALGLLILVLIVPAAMLVRRRPEDMGLFPDGVDPERHEELLDARARQRQRELQEADVHWSYGELVRSRELWILVVCAGLARFAMSATTLHMVPFLQDQGYSLLLAAGGLTIRSAITLAGDFCWGYSLDRLPLKGTAAFCFALTALGLAFWLVPPSLVTLMAGIVLFGVGASGTRVTEEVLWPAYFGRLSLGAVRGVSYPVRGFFAGLGPIAAGVVWDLTGAYTPAFAVMLVGCLLSAVLILTVQRPVKRSTPVGAAV
jgi:MFS transporter, OFA family, oxalate/formate antiporter